LHGCRVEDALARVDQFVDDAVMAGHAVVRLVHGHGTGALRKAIHRHLAALGVRGYRLGEAGMDPGASGVTIVTL
jgi:DNA mismatch repair protein MutS2